MKKGKAHKFARPFHGPYLVVELSPNDAKVVPVDRPREQLTYVALERLRQCPNELPPGHSPEHTAYPVLRRPPKVLDKKNLKQTSLHLNLSHGRVDCGLDAILTV